MAADGNKRKIKGAKGGQAQSRTPIEAPDSLNSTAYARILDLISEGEIYGFVNGPGVGALRDVYLDETPVANADGTLNFKNVNIESRVGTQTQDYMAGFPEVESEIGVGVELTAANPWVRAINNTQLNAVRVMISVPSLMLTDEATGDRKGYKIEYAIDIKADAGAYVEVYKGYFNGKTTSKYQRSHRVELPIATSNWTLRVRRLTADSTATNLQDTTTIESITEIIDARFRYPMSALVGVVVDASQFRAIPTRGYYIKGRILRVPANYNPITRQYATTGTGTSNGVWDGTFQSAWSNNPAWIYYDMVTNARYGLGHVITEAQIDKWSLYAIGQYCDGYVPTGALKRAAVTTGSVSLSTVAGNKYERATGSFLTDGFAVGDEILATGFANAANNGRGVITAVTATQITLDVDHALVVEGAAAARTLVTQNPTEPRFTASIYFQRQEEAFKVVQDLATIFRGISYWAGGALVPVCDMPTDPVYVYTNANVIDGKFTYQGSGRRARHTVALVSWSDPKDFGRTKVEYVSDELGIARYGIQQTQVMAIGCSSQGTARRLGKWILTSERLETDTVSFDVGLEGTLAAPGQVVRIADRARAGRRIGGRIVSATLGGIIVDSWPTVAPVAGDTLIIILPNGVAETRVVGTVDAATKGINPTSNFSAVPVIGTAWALETATLKTQLFRVISVSESKTNDQLAFSLVCLQHEAQKFNAVELGTLIEKRPISDIAPNVQLPPTLLTLTYAARAGNTLTSTVLTAGWTAAPGAVAYEVQWRPQNGEWTAVQRVAGLTTELVGAFAGEYQFRISAVGAMNVRSPPVLSALVTVPDQTLQPGFVATLNASIANALTTAQNAQATADGAIVSFWQISAPVIGSGAGQASVGDIWFDTDNGNKIYRVVGSVWVEAADDDMAQAILAASTAQATADGKVKTFFAATAPTPSGVGDLWFNTTTSKLTRWSGTIWADVADVTLDQLAGSGVNIVPDEYSTFSRSTLPTFILNECTVSRDAAAPYVNNSAALVVTNDGTYIAPYVFLTNSGNYNIPAVPGRKYILSAYVKPALANSTVQFQTQDSNGTYFSTGNLAVPTAGVWQRVSGLIDMTASSAKAFCLLLKNHSGPNSTIRVDAIMLEQMIGNQIAPSSYARGSTHQLALDALAAAATSQAAADGAIDIYRQSTQPAFPPAKLGDYWQNSGANNTWYRAEINGAWTLVEDPRVPQAILDAAAAQGTADLKIRTWFAVSTSVPTAAATGDLWYQTDKGFLLRWDGSAWVNTVDNSIMALHPFVINPGFEQGMHSWAATLGGESGWTVITSANSLTGAKMMQKSGGSTAFGGMHNNEAKFPFNIGQRYTIRVSVYAEAGLNAPAGGISVGMIYFNAAGAYLGHDLNQTYPDITSLQAQGKWYEFRATRAMPYFAQPAAYGKVFIGTVGYGGTGAWWFDSVNAYVAEDAAADGTNMIENSDFAQGTTRWGNVLASNILRNAESKFYAAGTLGAGVHAYPYQDVSLGVTPGEAYSASAEIWVNGLSSGYVYLAINGYSLDLGTGYGGVNSKVFYTNDLPNARWVRVSADNYVAPAGCALLRTIFDFNGAFTGARFRKLKLERGAVSTAWSPSDDGAWGGELATPGTNRRLGDQRNMPQALITALGSIRTTSSLTADSLGNVSVNAHTVRYGGTSVSYSAVTNAVTGLFSGSTYWIWCLDPDYAGGVQTWYAATSADSLMQQGNGVVYAGKITIPLSGSGGGGGAGDCVASDMLLANGQFAGEVKAGDMVACWDDDADLPEIKMVQVESNHKSVEHCTRLITESGAIVVASNSTPMTLQTGRVILIGQMLGELALVRLEDGTLLWEPVLVCEDAGLQEVSHIRVDQHSYFAGVNQDMTIATHNPTSKP